MKNEADLADAVTRVGEQVKTLRKAAGWSQAELAERAGLHRNEVSNLERGKGSRGTIPNPSLMSLLAIATALDTDPTNLLNPKWPNE